VVVEENADDRTSAVRTPTARHLLALLHRLYAGDTKSLL
jgi:hypothetical protein